MKISHAAVTRALRRILRYQRLATQRGLCIPAYLSWTNELTYTRQKMEVAG